MVEIYKNYTQSVYLLKYGFIRLILIKKALPSYYEVSYDVRNIPCIGPLPEQYIGHQFDFFFNRMRRAKLLLLSCLIKCCA